MNRKERRAAAKTEKKIVEKVRLEDDHGNARWVPADEVTDEQWADAGIKRNPLTGELTKLEPS